LETRP